ncbi:MAG: hypothetical protein GKS05_03640 [Nitrospirales bacterium]|nr:hypothetical protein [Nitrospirales bacterium]
MECLSISNTSNSKNKGRHRGPDDFGVWTYVEVGITFGYRCLSILDLSSAVRQPIVSQFGRYVITHNGQTYNFPELRKELEPLGHVFRGHADTEVILEAIVE